MRTVGVLILAGILGTSGSAWCNDLAPTFLRSISTVKYKHVTIQPDGTALAVSKDGVILKDPAGGTRFVARLKGNQRVVTSRDATAFGVTTYLDHSPTTLSVSKFDLYDAMGKRKFRLTKPKAKEFKISNAGQWTVGIASGEGMLEADLFLYNHLGEQVAMWKVPYLSEITLPDSGDRFFATSRNELWAYPYDGGDPHPFGRHESYSMNASGRWVALSGAGSISLFDGISLVYTAKTHLNQLRTVAVSPSGRYVALAGRDRLELFDRVAGEQVWTVTSGRESLVFISIALSESPLLVLCGLDEDRGSTFPASERHKSGALFLLAENGKLIWRENLKYTKWSFKIPGVSFVGDGKQFEVELSEERRHYQLP